MQVWAGAIMPAWIDAHMASLVWFSAHYYAGPHVTPCLHSGSCFPSFSSFFGDELYLHAVSVALRPEVPSPCSMQAK